MTLPAYPARWIQGLLTATILPWVITLAPACQTKTQKQQEDKDKQAVRLSPEDSALIARARAIFRGPLPKVADTPGNPLNPAKIQLGKMLYFDPRLSKSGFISCNSCHNLASFGVDNLPTSIGHRWQTGPRNAPTTLNAALHTSQFWDGRAKDVEEQAEKPILNPIEMAIPNEEFLVERLRSIPEYRELFKKAFPNEDTPLTYKNIARAIAAFERTLITPSRFDRFLEGDPNALTPEEKRGLKLFMDVGCITCHTGPLLGGNMFQKFGLFRNYWELTGSTRIDSGRYSVTRNEAELFVFKVPSLRNVAQTYPYFHDGSVWSLERAVEIMAEAQLNKKLSPDTVRAIVAFLKSLTGEIPEDALRLPVLPPSTETTSRPEI